MIHLGFGGDYRGKVSIVLAFFNFSNQFVLYIIVPIIASLYLYAPFLVFRSLVYDLNKNERKKINFQYIMCILIIGLSGLSYFYIDQVKTGAQVFTEIDENNEKKVFSLISKNKDLLKLKDSIYDLTPLFFAAKKNKPEVVKWILNNGGNINELDKDGDSLLKYVARTCNYELAEYLIKKGIDIKQMPQDDMNALFTAASTDCFVLVSYFRKLGMDANKLNRDGQNYIQYGQAKSLSFKTRYEFLMRNGLFN